MLLAGNMCDERLWDGLRPALGDRRILTPALVEDDTIAGMAARCLAAAEGPLIPIGFSMGGIVALAMAAQAPERLIALGLIDTNPSADLPERAAVRPRQQAEVRSGGLERIVVEELKPNYLAAANRGDRAMLALLRDMAIRLGPQVFVRQSEALRTRPDQSQVVEALDAPIFLACGAEDQLCPPRWHQAMAQAARCAELHVVPGAGHMLPLEQPRALSAALAAWLSRVESRMSCPLES
jgi:pimeloyl-ACP methyl ester carboxylesterase